MNKKYRLLIIGVILVVLAVIAFIFISNRDFRLVSTNPKLGGSIPTSTPEIILNFNRELRPDQELHNNISGDVGPVSNLVIDGQTILISLTSLEIDTNYHITLSNIESTEDEKIEKIDLIFSAVYVPYEDLSNEQKATQLANTDRDNKEDPIMEVLPHEGEGYYLEGKHTTGDDGVDDFILEAQIFLKRWELNNRQAAIDEYQRQVVEYITNRGFSIDDYFVDYVIIEPPTIAD